MILQKCRTRLTYQGSRLLKRIMIRFQISVKQLSGLCVLLLLIFMSGYLFIYNTLYISVNKDIRYYGQLKTIGTTSIQIRRMINKQVLWNTVIGIPLGLICSAVSREDCNTTVITPPLIHQLCRMMLKQYRCGYLS